MGGWVGCFGQGGWLWTGRWDTLEPQHASSACDLVLRYFFLPFILLLLFSFFFFLFFFLHNFRLALKVSVHVAERPQLTSAFLHYLYEARYSMWASQPIHYVYIFIFYVFRQTLFGFQCFWQNSLFWCAAFLVKGSTNWIRKYIKVHHEVRKAIRNYMWHVDSIISFWEGLTHCFISSTFKDNWHIYV